MKYPLAVHYVASNLWAIDPGKLAELVSVLAFRAAGHAYSAEEIQARIGAGGGSQEASRTQGGAVAVIPIRGVIAHRMSAMEDSSGGIQTRGRRRRLHEGHHQGDYSYPSNCCCRCWHCSGNFPHGCG